MYIFTHHNREFSKKLNLQFLEMNKLHVMYQFFRRLYCLVSSADILRYLLLYTKFIRNISVEFLMQSFSKILPVRYYLGVAYYYFSGY